MKRGVQSQDMVHKQGEETASPYDMPGITGPQKQPTEIGD